MVAAVTLDFNGCAYTLFTKNTFVDVPIIETCDPRRSSSWPAPARRKDQSEGIVAVADDAPKENVCTLTLLPSTSRVAEQSLGPDADQQYWSMDVESGQALADNQYWGMDDMQDDCDKEDWTDVRTVMMKGIPCRCTKEEVIACIHDVGFGDRFEFFYIPIKRCQRQNYGYAFVGFDDPATSIAFRDAITGYRFQQRSSSKVISLHPARLQGMDQAMDHFRDSKVVRSKWCPTFKERLLTQ
jgi:hypothetical protein